MSGRQIPKAPGPATDRARYGFDAAVKERLEVIAAVRGERIAPLDTSTATAADCAAKINELLALLQP